MGLRDYNELRRELSDAEEEIERLKYEVRRLNSLLVQGKLWILGLTLVIGWLLWYISDIKP